MDKLNRAINDLKDKWAKEKAEQVKEEKAREKAIHNHIKDDVAEVFGTLEGIEVDGNIVTFPWNGETITLDIDEYEYRKIKTCPTCNDVMATRSYRKKYGVFTIDQLAECVLDEGFMYHQCVYTHKYWEINEVITADGLTFTAPTYSFEDKGNHIEMRYPGGRVLLMNVIRIFYKEVTRTIHPNAPEE